MQVGKRFRSKRTASAVQGVILRMDATAKVKQRSCHRYAPGTLLQQCPQEEGARVLKVGRKQSFPVQQPRDLRDTRVCVCVYVCVFFFARAL